MQDSVKQPAFEATRHVAASSDLVHEFRSQLNTHWQAFQFSLVLQFERHISVLQDENQTLRRQLLDCVVANSEGGSVSQKYSTSTVVDIDFPDSLLPKKTTTDGIGNHNGSCGSATPGVAENDRFATSAQGHPSMLKFANGIVKPTPSKAEFRRAPPMMFRERVVHHAATVQLHRMGSTQLWLHKFVSTKRFEIFSACIILLNTAVMAMQLQYDGFDVGHDLEWSEYSNPAKGTWPWFKDFSRAAGFVFNALFCIELLLRVVAAGRHCCCQPWIIFDAIIVTMSMMDLLLPSGSIPVNPAMMRISRLVRLVRLLKLLHTMTAFDSLFLLLKSVKASIHAAFWSFLMLATIQLIVGLFLNQVLIEYVKDEDNVFASREEVFRYFGTFSRTMLTMFEITFANWVISCRMLMERVSEWFIIIFLAYRCFFCFAVLKVISAVFITETNRVLEHDDELTVMKKSRDKLFLSRRVHSLTRNLVQGDSGTIGWDAFEKIAEDAELQRLLVPLGFEIHDMEKLFWLLQDGSGLVQVEEFLSKVGRLRGNAKSIDAQTLIKIAHGIDELLHKVFHKQGYMQEAAGIEKTIEDKACSF